MNSIDTIEGDKTVVTRSNIYSDVLTLYQCGFAQQYPIIVEFKGEKAVDCGGVSKEMYSSFWEQAYLKLFDGDKVLTPLLHSSESDFNSLGKVISHGYMVSGHLPVRIALPTLMMMILGPLTRIPPDILIDAFLEFVSSNERLKIKSFLESSVTQYTNMETSEIVSILSKFGCFELPNAENLRRLIVETANLFFVRRSASITLMIHRGIPDQHRFFWTDLDIDGIANVYRLLSVSAEKFLNAIQECEFRNEAEERIYSYLIRMIESMKINSLRNFLRFWTGSSVLITDKLFVIFTYGYSPFAHTCGNTLELPLNYTNFQQFEFEWDTILNNIQEEWTWCMDSL